MDRYGQKPTNDQLLHDLMRVIGVEPFGKGFKFTPPLSAAPSVDPSIQGPVERITAAVEDYTFEEATQISLGTSPNGDAELSIRMEEEHDAWGKVCAELRELGVEINDQDKLTALLRLWGERVVKLRYNQGRSTMGECLDRALVNAKPFGADFPHDPDA